MAAGAGSGLIPDLDGEPPRTPWGWLRGFGWFLLAWPLFGLLALGELGNFDWESILIAMLAPAGIGGALLLVERALTRWLGAAAMAAAQPAPSLIRDLSTLGLALTVLLGIDVALVLAFEERNIFTREDLSAGPIAAWMVAGLLTATLLLRGLHRLAFGPPRRVDLGPDWDDPHTAIRWLGYLTLVPMLLVCTVMLDYTLRERPDFGPTAWIVLPLLLLLGLRSAMARSPRHWARSPWEGWLRARSLAFPWWVIGFVVGAGTCVLLIIAPFAMPDEEITFAGRIITGVLLVPIGGLGVYIAAGMLWRELPLLRRRIRLARRLDREPAALLGWSLEISGGTKDVSPVITVWLQIPGDRVPFHLGAEDDPLVRWLRARGSAQMSS